MGIDFTHKKIKDNEETAHWSYGGFNRFREKLAKEVGIANLNEMDGWKTDTGNHLGKYIEGISWSKIKHPIKYLLNHSDCDGQISAKRCGELADIIYFLVSKWNIDDYDRQQGQILALNMKMCHKKNVPLIFL